MGSTILKGKISAADHAVKYDDEGIEYFLYTITIDKKKYTSKTPRGLYLSSDSPIVCEVENDTILAGYCPIQNHSWGKNVRRLKKQVDPTELYTFVHGKMIEKRKETFRSVNQSDVDPSPFKTTTTFTVVLENAQFRASEEDGKKIKADDELAVVLFENGAVLMKNLKTGKFIGWNTPYFMIGLIIFLMAINVSIYYAQQKHPGLLIDPTTTYWVLNIVFGFILVSNIFSFFGTRHAKRFMLEQLKKIEK
ncbi:MAG: hypothetical protein IPO32_08980 [Crocinitomicaceae bacterium]|nr:hypothetical protein [Crocinitomicaceae bacterium]